MLGHIRWQIVLAAVGAAIVGLVLYLVSNRAFAYRPARGGTAVEAVVGVPATLNPLLATQDVELDVARLIHAGLTRPGDDGRVRPDLADRWTIRDEGRVYTFHLRDDAVWHDGRPVTADDVLFTARMAVDPGVATERHPLAAAWSLAAVRAVDARTVEFTLETPYAPFLDATMLGLLPAHAFAGVAPAELHRHPASTQSPIGAGPWRLDQPGGLTAEHVRLVRFADHWEATARRPYLDGIELRLFATAADAVQALGRREAQVMGQVPAEALFRLGEDVAQINAVRSGFTAVFLNPSKVIFADARIRHALSASLDRAAIIQGPDLLAGQGVPASSPIPPGSWAHDPSIPAPAFDPDEAARVLDAAGWTDTDGDGVRDRDGQPLRFALDVYDDPLLLAIARRLETDWGRLGVGVEVREQSQPNLVAALTTHAYEAALYAVTGRQLYDPDPYPLWHSSQIEGGQNLAAFANARADEILVALRRTSPADEAARRALYVEFQRLFAAEEPALMLYHPVYSIAKVAPALGGVQLPPLLVEPADRYRVLGDWFLETERVLVGGQDG